MCWPRRALVALTFAALPLATLSQLPARDAEQDSRQLRELKRKSPEEYARLLQEARVFLARSQDDRDRLVKLDHDLEQLPAGTAEHLREVLRRYAEWLERLPEADRQAIRAAPDRVQRLRQIREVKEAQWLRALPLAVRDRLRELRGKEWTAEIARLRQEEQERRRDWQVALHSWKYLGLKEHWPAARPAPTRWSELDAADQAFLQEYLRPRLTAAEWAQLEKTQGPWPRFARTLVETADRHPPALRGARGPSHVKELPREVLTRLSKAFRAKFGKGKKNGLWANLAPVDRRWPAFAVKVSEVARLLDVSLPHELWPSRRKDLSWGVQDFLARKLAPALDPIERGLLKQAEGSWPRYPQTIQELAQKHSLSVPWQTLPGSRTRWDCYRLPQATARTTR
jgi:hypothetical protein